VSTASTRAQSMVRALWGVPQSSKTASVQDRLSSQFENSNTSSKTHLQSCLFTRRAFLLVQRRERHRGRETPCGTAQLRYHISFSNYILYDAPSIHDGRSFARFHGSLLTTRSSTPRLRISRTVFSPVFSPSLLPRSKDTISSCGSKAAYI